MTSVHFGTAMVVADVKFCTCGRKLHGLWGQEEASIKFWNWKVTELSR